MKQKPLKKTKILVINFGGIGDEILFLPTLNSIKKTYPNSEIIFVTEPRSKSIKELTNLIDEVITCDIKTKDKYKNIFKFLTKVKKKKFDLVISSGSTKLVCILLFLTEIKTKIGYNSGFLSKILLTKAISLNKNQYAACMYNDLTKGISENNTFELPQIKIDQVVIDKAKQYMPKNNKKTIIIHPGVSKLSIEKKIIKFWSAKNWTQLIISLLNSNKYNVILVGGFDDNQIINCIRKNLSKLNISKEKFIDLYGKTTSIAELAGFISLSDLLICVDSGPMHIGVGLKTLTIALFGPTDEKKLLPKDKRFISIKNEKTKCRPCLWDKRQTSCSDLDCLDISPETVYENVIELI